MFLMWNPPDIKDVALMEFTMQMGNKDQGKSDYENLKPSE